MRPGREDAIRHLEAEAQRRAERKAEAEIHPEPRWLGPFVYGMAILAAAAVSALIVHEAAGAPCAKHEGSAKAQCAKAAKAQAKRDALRFPPSPTMNDLKKRVPDWFGFVRLGRCEQPGPGKWGVRWDHPGPTWGGGVGLYRGTWQAAGSPYRVFSGSIPETILVADAIRDRFGITAWGAWRCFRP
jgi:hypothetical protein